MAEGSGFHGSAGKRRANWMSKAQSCGLHLSFGTAASSHSNAKSRSTTTLIRITTTSFAIRFRSIHTRGHYTSVFKLNHVITNIKFIVSSLNWRMDNYNHLIWSIVTLLRKLNRIVPSLSKCSNRICTHTGVRHAYNRRADSCHAETSTGQQLLWGNIYRNCDVDTTPRWHCSLGRQRQ